MSLFEDVDSKWLSIKVTVAVFAPSRPMPQTVNSPEMIRAFLMVTFASFQ
ncbi:hypothetical protein [Alistipes dispar]|nr:hypothetical protein [Alistipes dispar]